VPNISDTAVIFNLGFIDRRFWYALTEQEQVKNPQNKLLHTY